MRQSLQCKERKSDSAFPVTGSYTRVNGTKTTLYKSLCKLCYNAKVSSDYQALMAKYVGTSCTNCGYDKCSAALELHHTDGEDKQYTVASRWSISEKRFVEEVSKCILLCANCHRELHAMQRSTAAASNLK